MQIYLDYSATTPPRPEVIAEVQRVMQAHWGNPSSLHQWGNRAATVLEQARLQVGELINAPPEAVIFTAGGTEADNLALFGVTKAYRLPQHIIISAVEHAAIASPAQQLEQAGWQVTRLPVDSQARVSPQALRQALRDNTVLVSIIYGQSEVGTLQDIAHLGQIVRDHGARFHTDAVQVAGRLPLDVQTLPVDLLSLSSHKIYGPQGVGALYRRPGLDLSPLLWGGGQESGQRSGTPALAAIAGFGVAARLARLDMAAETPRLVALRDRLGAQLQSLPYLELTGHRQHRLPHHASFCFTAGDGQQVTGRTLVRQMNLAGIGISAGTACHSGTLNPSGVLKAMGYSDRAARCGIRFSLGRQTSEADIDWTAMVLQQVLHRCLDSLTLSRV
ncbi:MAG: cysteine desulfurase [Cyanobacteria bacterium REEB459]|nr:cysteine desulfurase [Cyanobacteria bacterium REEB459]